MATAPYDSLEAVMNAARVRLLDAIQSLNGEIITDTATFTLTMVNAAWRCLQQYLGALGFSVLDSEVILSNVPAWTSGDPAVFAFFDWSQYSNGTNTFDAPVLPQNAICPLKLYERQNGSGTQFIEMDKVKNGLPTANPGGGAGARDIINRLWEWRGNAVYLPGATTATDIRMRYASYLADFEAPGTTAFAAQPVPIMRALNAFAYYICAEAAKARGDMDSGDFEAKAQSAADEIFNRNDGPRGMPQVAASPTPQPGGNQ